MAKLASEELEIDRLWNDLVFRETTIDDEERIHLALDGEEAGSVIADWSVKLGINLFYSVNLGWSSLYSKQMPYNSIMHNAFGRSPPGSSLVKLEVNQSRQGRQKKMVAGKWCGRVWMSNQVHPFLNKQDVVGQNQEKEQEEKLYCGEVPDVAHEREAQSTLKIGTDLTVKSGKKRKITARTCLAKKVQCMETEDTASVGLVEENSQQQGLRIYSRRKTKAAEKKVPCDLLKHSLQQQIIRNGIIKCTYSTEGDDAVSDDPPEDATNHEMQSHRQFSRGLTSKQTLNSEGNSSKNKRERFSRAKQTKCIVREDATSDDSLGNTIHQWGDLRKMQQKFNQRGKSTAPQYTDSEDLVSDDSLKNVVSNNLAWEVSGGNQVSHSETDNVVSDHSGEESNSSSRSTGSEQDQYSDDSPEETVLKQQHKRLLGKKRHKFLGIGYAMSDCVANSSDHVTNRRTTNSEGGGLIQNEDADSDDMLSNYTNQQLTRKSRRSRTYFMEREDEGLEDLQEANSRRNRRKMFMNKKAKSNKESVRDVTLRQMQKENSLSINQRRQLKREAPRGNVKSEKAWLFDSHMEEDLEDGPSTRLRRKPAKLMKFLETKSIEKLVTKRKLKAVKAEEEAGLYQCDIEGCSMSFVSRQAMALHKKNICPEEGCGKKFFSHKYLVQHRRVHLDDRPLKCPWKGCRKTFKWAWARTEHIRVHTGERPYICAEKGCGQSFRFVSDFSRHKRKTGHSVRKGRK